jgi:hypothetical protein
VPKERELGKDHAESASQRQYQNREDHDIEAAAMTLQPSDTDGLGQLGECVSKRLMVSGRSHRIAREWR